MVIEKSKIIGLIASYEEYEEECRSSGSTVDLSRAGLYRTVVEDLKELLPRKSLAQLEIVDYDDLTGAMIECRGRRGVLLCGSDESVTVFILSNRHLDWCEPEGVYLIEEDRLWDETGTIL